MKCENCVHFGKQEILGRSFDVCKYPNILKVFDVGRVVRFPYEDEKDVLCPLKCKKISFDE